MTSAVGPAATQGVFGRDDLLARLGDTLASVAGGEGRLVWLAGEAGIGKTRLLAELERLAVARGFRALHATAWDDPGTPPFWLWVQVLREAAGGRSAEALAAAWGARARPALDLLPGSVAPTAPHDGARFALFDAVEAALESQTVDAPLLLVLDDLHWTDAGSLRALQHVARSLPRLPLLVAAGWRTHEVTDADVLARADDLAVRADVVELTGIPATAVSALLADTTGLHVDDRQAELVARRTGGNPLFVRELARLALDRGGSGRQLDRLVEEGVPGSARAIIGRRLARVSQACQELLSVAAVAGNAASLELVAGLSGTDVATTSALLDEGVAADLASVSAGRVTFSHPLVRDTLVSGFPAGRAREVHLEAARLLAPLVDATPAGAAEVAHHLRSALPLGDPREAVEMLGRAARVAFSALAFEEAARHLEQALEIAPAADAPARFELLLSWGEALAAAGTAEGAREAYTQAAALARAGRDADGLARAALGFGSGLSGFEVQLWDQAQIDLLEEALAALPATDSQVRADVMARLSVALAFTEGAHRRDELAAEAVAMARRVGSPRAVAHALAAHCDAVSGPDHAELREREAGEVVARAHDAGDRGLELLGLRLRVVARLEQGDSAGAHEDMATFDRLARRVGQPLYSWFVPLWQGFESHAAGDLDELERCTAEVERIGALAESTNAHVLGIVQRSWLSIERLRAAAFVDEMRALMEELAALAPDGGVMFGLYPGQPDALRRSVVPRLAASLPRLPRDAEHLSNLSLVAITLWDADEEADAAEAVHAALLPYRHRYAVDGIGAGAIGSVERLLGMTATLAGRLDDAVDHFEAAIDGNTRAGLRLPAAHARAALAECLRRRDAPGDRERRSRLLTEAREEYAAMGIPERVAVVDTALAGAGPSTAGPPAPAGSSSASLRRAADVWEVAFRGRTATVRHAKGLTDLAALLSRPGHEVHVLDLVGGGSAGGGPVGSRGGDLGEVLDPQARDAYRRRLAELDAALADAEADGDAEEAARVTGERDFLVAELASAYGLGGRTRRAGDPAERARTTVTWRLRDAVKRLEAVHPELGRHLRSSLRTGTFCAYDPEQPVVWDTRPTS